MMYLQFFFKNTYVICKIHYFKWKRFPIEQIFLWLVCSLSSDSHAQGQCSSSFWKHIFDFHFFSILCKIVGLSSRRTIDTQPQEHGHRLTCTLYYILDSQRKNVQTKQIPQLYSDWKVLLDLVESREDIIKSKQNDGKTILKKSSEWEN